MGRTQYLAWPMWRYQGMIQSSSQEAYDLTRETRLLHKTTGRKVRARLFGFCLTKQHHHPQTPRATTCTWAGCTVRHLRRFLQGPCVALNKNLFLTLPSPSLLSSYWLSPSPVDSTSHVSQTIPSFIHTLSPLGPQMSL